MNKAKRKQMEYLRFLREATEIQVRLLSETSALRRERDNDYICGL